MKSQRSLRVLPKYIEDVDIFDKLEEEPEEVPEATEEDLHLVRLVILEIILYLVYIVTGVIGGYDYFDASKFEFFDSMNKLFFHGIIYVSPETTRPFSSMMTSKNYYDFLTNKFMPRLLDESTKRAEATKKHYFIDENILLGPPIIRQSRVKPKTCNGKPIFPEYGNICYGKYTSGNEFKTGLFNGQSYTNMQSLTGTSIEGKLTTYNPGGFIKELNMNLAKTKQILNELKKQKWIDEATRMVVVEFSAYNDNSKLFNSVKFITEFPCTGGIMGKIQIDSVRAYSGWNHPYNSFIKLCKCTFIMLHLSYTIGMLRKFKTEGLFVVLSSFSNIFSIVIYLGIWSFLVFETWQTWYLIRLEETFRTQKDKFIRLDNLTYWSDNFLLIFYICFFFSQIKFLRFLQVDKNVVVFNKAIKNCVVMWAFIMFSVVVYIGFTLFGYFAFGQDSEQFTTLKGAALALLQVTMGFYSFDEHIRLLPIFGGFYFISFLVFYYFIILNMLIKLVQDAYIAATNKSTIHDSGAEERLGEVIRDCFRNFWLALSRKKKEEPKKEVEEEEIEEKLSEEFIFDKILRGITEDSIEEEIEDEELQALNSLQLTAKENAELDKDIEASLLIQLGEMEALKFRLDLVEEYLLRLRQKLEVAYAKIKFTPRHRKKHPNRGRKRKCIRRKSKE